MINLHTNLSALTVQKSLINSTNKLNTAIERMSTGYKINHASDNAANYSISKNMSTQLSACDVAADNISMGMDLLQTAQDTIAGMQDRANRIHALITQARNGTYGADSLNAMTQEANALVSEINRLYINTEYNGIKIFDDTKLPEWARNVQQTAGTINGKSLEECAAMNKGFIAEVDMDTPGVIVTDPLELEDAISANAKIGIGNAETLAELAKIVNGTDGYTANNCSGKTIILTEDVNLSEICADNTDGEGVGGWNPIGNISNRFLGTFNGNGHKVTGLYINRPDADYQGLFGCANQIKNIAVEDVNVKGKTYVGGLAGKCGTVCNSCTSGYVSGGSVGGITGNSDYNLSFSHSACTVEGKGQYTGGLTGGASVITDCYATGNVNGLSYIGGVAGFAYGNVTNSYATGNVTGALNVGGLLGQAYSNVSYCYSTGNVNGNSRVGGLIGDVYRCAPTIDNCYASGDIHADNGIGGGLCGVSGSITNSFSLGNVSSDKAFIGGLIGQINKTSDTLTLSNVLSAGNVSGNGKTGSFIGGIINTADGVNFSTITIKNASAKEQNIDMIGGTYSSASGNPAVEYDMSGWLKNIAEISGEFRETNLHVGTNGGTESQISIDTTLSFELKIPDLTDDAALESISGFLNLLNEKAVAIGATQNRLESALESNLVKMDNLTSSLSTIRDADISKVSSDFIRQQILQQACATLMSTANQSPAIALQLI